jgi:hypothetical protein
MMDCVRSTARLHDDAADVEGEGASVESRGNGGSAERTELVQASDVGSHSGAEADTDEDSRTRCRLLLRMPIRTSFAMLLLEFSGCFMRTVVAT